MARYDRGYDGRGGYRGPAYAGFGRRGPRGDRGYRYDRGGRPWEGGYRPYYRTGPGGAPTSGRRPPSYDRDFWWLGEHELNRQGYFDRPDRAFAEFDRHAHPRYSPVGGTYAAMGGSYAYHRPPRPLREDSWFSDWTRWF
jgi:hypothetical protein